MKLYTLIITSLLISFNATATSPIAESEVFTTEQESGSTLLESNFTKINTLKDKINKIDYVLETFAICEAKNMTYLGENVKGADSDNCIDIQAVEVRRNSKEPTISGFASSDVFLGTLTTSTSAYNSSNTSESWHRTKADKFCRSHHAANSRAMTSNDVKYLINDLYISIGNFNHTSKSKYLWVFDAEQSLVEAGKASTKFDSTLTHNNCQGWSSFSSSDYGVVLEVKASGSNNYIQYNTLSCDQKALILCITN